MAEFKVFHRDPEGSWPSFPVSYNFSNKDPNDILTKDELEHFDEGMEIQSDTTPTENLAFWTRPQDDLFGKAVKSVSGELDTLLS